MCRLLVALILLLMAACAEHRILSENWAEPVNNHGLDNFYRVSEGIYRSEQPGRDEFRSVQTLGIGEILNLREYHSNQDETRDYDLTLHRIRTDPDEITEDQLIEALKIINNRQYPILVHCWHGADRTGAVIAAYRIVMQGWSKKEAIEELVKGGFGHHAWFYPNIVVLIEDLDVAYMRAKLGLDHNMLVTH